MATTIEELEKRVAALERELRYLRREFGIWTPGETPAEARESQAEVDAAWARVKEELGIHGDPIGPEKLQERMLASGIKPEDNLLSRGIIEMREE
jgi:hypothetical protein